MTTPQSTKEENIKTLETIDPDTLFSDNFQNQNAHLRDSFSDFFNKNYTEMTTVKEVTYSTNHVTYYFFKNENNQDVRIIRAESGCFHSNERFVTLESIEKHLNSIKSDKERSIQNTTKEEITRLEDYFNPKISSLEQVFTTYKQLKNHIIKPKI